MERLQMLIDKMNDVRSLAQFVVILQAKVFLLRFIILSSLGDLRPCSMLLSN